MTNAWLGVEIRHLVALSAVAREGSFRGAADELGYVQSAVSQQISQLERLLGCRLLERTRGMRGCKLTPAGEVLLEHVDQIVARYQAAQADMAALHTAGERVLRVGVAGSVATRLLPGVIRRMATAAPETRLVQSGTRIDAELFALVANGDADVAFGVLPLEPGPFELQELLVEPLVLVVQAGSPLARATTPPTVEEVAHLPLIAVTDGRPETAVEAWLLAQGATPRIAHFTDSDAMAQALVAGGLGVAILPRFAVNPHDERTAVVELGETAPLRHLAVYWHRERHPMRAMSEFRVAAGAAARELTGSGTVPPTTPERLFARAA